MKQWDINIYRGILTGYNDAFIINGQTKARLIDEDPKSAEIIRPILRGRDIKRYGYEFADLWLIATFPSKKYDIDEYPAIKRHLLSFGIERLEQTGKVYMINGKKVAARKKTTNKWFETQDSISYWDDFSKQKIIYPETTQHASFYFDEDGSFYVDKTCFILISKYNYYLLATLSSSLFEYAYKRIFSSIELGLTGYQYNKHALIELPICPLNLVSKDILDKINSLTQEIKRRDNFKATFKEIDSLIFSIYNINDEEQQHIYNKLSLFSN